MALWRDPLDELIGELEHVIPAKPTTVAAKPKTVAEYQALFSGLQTHVNAILWGGPGELERAERDPQVKACLAWSESLGPVDAQGQPIPPTTKGDME